MTRARTPCRVLRTMGGACRHIDFRPFTMSVPAPPTSFSLSKALPAYLCRHAFPSHCTATWTKAGISVTSANALPSQRVRARFCPPTAAWASALHIGVPVFPVEKLDIFAWRDLSADRSIISSSMQNVCLRLPLHQACHTCTGRLENMLTTI